MDVEKFKDRKNVTYAWQFTCNSGIVTNSRININVCEYHQGRTVCVNLCKPIHYLQASVSPSDCDVHKAKCDPSGNIFQF